jgi:hypothetical protein
VQIRSQESLYQGLLLNTPSLSDSTFDKVGTCSRKIVRLPLRLVDYRINIETCMSDMVNGIQT